MKTIVAVDEGFEDDHTVINIAKAYTEKKTIMVMTVEIKPEYKNERRSR